MRNYAGQSCIVRSFWYQLSISLTGRNVSSASLIEASADHVDGKPGMRHRWANPTGAAVSRFSWGERVSDAQAFAQLPIIIALAGKNNLISFLTGVPYQELNYLHRASGRLCLLCSWLHTIGWIDGAYDIG
jgi:hypothetical protein